MFHIFKRFWWFEHLARTKSVLCASIAQYCFSNRAQWNRFSVVILFFILCVILCCVFTVWCAPSLSVYERPIIRILDWKCLCLYCVCYSCTPRISMHEILISVLLVVATFFITIPNSALNKNNDTSVGKLVGYFTTYEMILCIIFWGESETNWYIWPKIKLRHTKSSPIFLTQNFLFCFFEASKMFWSYFNEKRTYHTTKYSSLIQLIDSWTVRR